MVENAPQKPYSSHEGPIERKGVRGAGFKLGGVAVSGLESRSTQDVPEPTLDLTFLRGHHCKKAGFVGSK